MFTEHRENVLRVLKFRGLEPHLLKPVADTTSTLTLMLSSLWLVVAALGGSLATGLRDPLPYFVSFGVCFVLLYVLRPVWGDRLSGVALGVMLCVLSLFLRATFEQLSVGALTMAAGLSMILLSKGTLWATICLSVVLIARAVLALLSEINLQAVITGAGITFFISFVASIALMGVVNIIHQQGLQLLTTLRKLGSLRENRNNLFSMLARDIARPVGQLHSALALRDARDNQRRELHQHAESLLTVIDGLDAALNVRELPPVFLQEHDVVNLILDVQRQSQILLAGRNITVSVQVGGLPVNIYSLDATRMRTMLLGAAHVVYLVDDDFQELSYQVEGRRLSDAQHEVEFKVSVAKTQLKLSQLEDAFSGNSVSMGAEELAIASYFEEVKLIGEQLGARLKLAGPSGTSTASLTMTFLLEPGSLMWSDTIGRTGAPTLSSAAASPGTNINHVLIVDDDPVQRRVLRQLVKSTLRASVTAAGSADEAIRHCNHDNSFDLILIDYLMPEKNGADLMSELAPKLRVPMIGITAATRDADRESMMAAGAAAVLTKPVNNKVLLDAIGALPKSDVQH